MIWDCIPFFFDIPGQNVSDRKVMCCVLKVLLRSIAWNVQHWGSTPWPKLAYPLKKIRPWKIFARLSSSGHTEANLVPEKLISWYHLAYFFKKTNFLQFPGKINYKVTISVNKCKLAYCPNLSFTIMGRCAPRLLKRG